MILDFNNFDLNRKNQFGFRSCRGTVDVIVSLIKSIKQKCHNHIEKKTDIMHLHRFEKAINTVNHVLLFKKNASPSD